MIANYQFSAAPLRRIDYGKGDEGRMQANVPLNPFPVPRFPFPVLNKEISICCIIKTPSVTDFAFNGKPATGNGEP
jgi:hypothetical protein